MSPDATTDAGALRARVPALEHRLGALPEWERAALALAEIVREAAAPFDLLRIAQRITAAIATTLRASRADLYRVDGARALPCLASSGPSTARYPARRPAVLRDGRIAFSETDRASGSGSLGGPRVASERGDPDLLSAPLTAPLMARG